MVDRCRAGDAAAWEEIVRAHGARIYRLCFHLTGRAADAQDVTQEVFIKAYRSLAQYDPARASLATWITAIARHAVVDHFRRTKRDRQTESLDAILDENEDGPAQGFEDDETPPPDAGLARREAQARVQGALARLSPEFREVVILRDLQDMDYADIAAALGVPEGTVKSRLSRGRAELARLLSRIYPQVPSR